MLSDESDDRLQRVATGGRHAEHLADNLPELQIRDDPMLQQLITDRSPNVMPSYEAAYANQPVIAQRMQPQYMISVPILLADGFLGLVGAGAFKDDPTPPLTPNDHVLFTMLANVTAVALASIHHQAQTAHQRDLRLALERQRRLQRLRLLTGGMVHDFNNMLSVFRTGTELLLSTDTTLEQEQILAMMTLAEGNAATLASQLLALGNEEVRLVLAQTEVEPLLQRSALLTRGTLDGPTTLQVHCDPGLPLLLVDSGVVIHVLVNLILNARDALDPDGGTIQLLARHVAPADRPGAVTGDGPCVRIDVVDDGVGMRPDIAAKVFDPFFTTKLQGTGLGLAAAAEHIARLRGVITCTSRLDTGTTFSVFLPGVTPTA